MQLNQHTVTDLQKSGLITSRISTDIPWPSQDSPVTQKRGILPPAAGGEWCRVTNPVYSVINEITAGGEKDSHVESHLRDLLALKGDDLSVWWLSDMESSNSLIKMRHLLSDSSEGVVLASCVTRHRYLPLECMILFYITVTCLLGPMGMFSTDGSVFKLCLWFVFLSAPALIQGDWKRRLYDDLQSSLNKRNSPSLCFTEHFIELDGVLQLRTNKTLMFV